MELVRVFDEDFQYIEDDRRDHVHVKGKWHETFHCWFIDDKYVYIQKRSATKSDFPLQFDITAAGHLEAHERVEDGVREIEEELGIRVDFAELTKVDIVKDVIELPNFLDYEFAHVYVYEASFQASDFSLQIEEVESIYKIRREDFIRLCFQELEEVVGFHLETEQQSLIRLTDFVPHQLPYFYTVAKALSLAK